MAPERPPVEVGKNRCAEADRTVFPNRDSVGMEVINIDKVGDPDIFPKLYPPHSMEPGTQTAPSRTHKRNQVQKSSNKVENHVDFRRSSNGKQKIAGRFCGPGKAVESSDEAARVVCGNGEKGQDRPAKPRLPLSWMKRRYGASDRTGLGPVSILMAGSHHSLRE